MTKPNKDMQGTGRVSWAQVFILPQLLKQEVW